VSTQRTAYLKLHTSVFLFGFTAILGALISLQSAALVWYRLLLTVSAYLLWLGFRGELRRIPRADIWQMGRAGLVLGLHWITFYASIKLAGASVALVCLSAASVCTALLEPLLYRTPFSRRDLLLGCVVVVGIYLVFTFQPEGKSLGIVVGLISALLSALTGILNKRIVSRYPGPLVNCYEQGICLVLFTFAAPFYIFTFPQEQYLPTQADWLWLLLLALVCTNFAYNWSMAALREVSTFDFILAINLEPIYGIVLAYFILHENREVSPGFVAGVLLVLGSVFFGALLKYAERWRAGRKA